MANERPGNVQTVDWYNLIRYSSLTSISVPCVASSPDVAVSQSSDADTEKRSNKGT